jgi:hypothetical protein
VAEWLNGTSTRRLVGQANGHQFSILRIQQNTDHIKLEQKDEVCVLCTVLE